MSGRFVFQDENIVHHPGLSHPLRRSNHPTIILHFPKRRVLVWITYRLDMKLWHKNASGWRATSFAIHLLNTALLIPFSSWAALFFLVHPLTLMGSSYVAGRANQLQTTAALLAILAVLHGYFVIAIVISGVVSLWLKEDSVVLFPLIGALWMLS